MSELNKKTEGDKRRILSRAVSSKFSTNMEPAFLDDYDDENVFWSVWDPDQFVSFKSSYTFVGVTATINDDKVKVEATTDFEEVVEKSTEDKFATKLLATLDKYFGGSDRETKPLIKQFDEDSMIAVEPLYIAIGDVDGVGDTYASPEVCHDMVESFNKAIESGNLKGNYFHKFPTDDFTILKAWVTETDSIIGETEVKEGLPLVKIQFNKSEAWELRKSGGLKGVSIGAIATWEDV